VGIVFVKYYLLRYWNRTIETIWFV